MERSIIRAAGAISYLPRWAHILALVESLVLVAILVLVDIFLPGWDWIMLLLLPIAIFVSLLIAKRKTRERKKEQLDNQPLAREADLFCKQNLKMENKMENRKQGTDHPSVGRETTKQRVTITRELKVTVLTDHGVIEDGREGVLIKGDFVIDERSVALLNTALAGKAVREMWFSDRGYSIIAPADAVSTLSEELKKQKEEYDKMENIMAEKLAVKENERHKLKCENIKLRQEIKLFNESRRPWERKLKIEE